MPRRWLRILTVVGLWRLVGALVWFALAAVNVQMRFDNAVQARQMAAATPSDPEFAGSYRRSADRMRRNPPTWWIGFCVAHGLYWTWPIPARWRAFRRDERVARGLCPACGYDLTGNASGACPECGAPAGKAAVA